MTSVPFFICARPCNVVLIINVLFLCCHSKKKMYLKDTGETRISLTVRRFIYLIRSNIGVEI